MPPEGYESLTVPEELADELDEYGETPAKAIRYLIGLEAGDETAAGVASIADAVAARVEPGGVDTDALVADLKADLAPAVADEVEARLR